MRAALAGIALVAILAGCGGHASRSENGTPAGRGCQLLRKGTGEAILVEFAGRQERAAECRAMSRSLSSARAFWSLVGKPADGAAKVCTLAPPSARGGVAYVIVSDKAGSDLGTRTCGELVGAGWTELP